MCLFIRLFIVCDIYCLHNRFSRLLCNSPVFERILDWLLKESFLNYTKNIDDLCNAQTQFVDLK